MNKLSSFLLLLFAHFCILAQSIHPNVAFVKLKPEYAHYFSQNNRLQNNVFSKIGLKKVESFANSNTKKQRNNNNNENRLSRIYQLDFDYDVLQAIEELKTIDIFEVIEPSPIFQVLYQPNDPVSDSTKTNNGAPHLSVHNFYKAWEIEKGDTNVTIGIVDTGINFDHEDLKDNLKYNPFDPVDGINNDGDFYFEDTLTDNFRGWDMADKDNDPTGLHPHGTNVAGIACATANNDKGIVGVAFNCRYLPIKAAPDAKSTSISHGYDGLKYAAEHDCKVINLSWGSTIPFYTILNDLVNYAVLDMNAVVVAASGNSGKEEYYYPASFSNVLSVGSLEPDSTVVNSSTYNYEVDLIAVGASMKVANTGIDGYKIDGGTSLAAPVVSGAIALIRSKYPQLTAKQVMEKVRISGDIIDTISNKIPAKFKDKIGRMLNPIRALTNDSIPSLRTIDYHTNKSDNYISQKGDTVLINLHIINYLAKSKNAKITVKSISDNFTFIDSTATLIDLNTWDTTKIEDSPLKLYIPADTSSSIKLTMRVEYESDNHLDHQYINLTFKPTVISSHNENTVENPIQTIVYPNPFSSTIFLTFDEKQVNSTVQFELYNSQQQLVFQSEKDIKFIDEKLELNELNLSSGVYFLKIKNSTFTEHHRLIKY